VQPSASRDEVVGVVDGVVRVRVCAPPVQGKANAAVVALLARALGVSKANLSIVRGAMGRTKVVSVEGVDREEALVALARHRGGGPPA
jgi:uncharacterized protein (TIGR00251 family)